MYNRPPSFILNLKIQPITCLCSVFLNSPKNIKKLHPEYIDPLAKFSPGDPKLATIKRQALSPYLSSLEEQRILYNDHILVSAFLFDVEINENGFIAELWKIKTLQLPHYPYPFGERKTWTIQSDWEHLRLLGNRMNCLPYGWSFRTE